MAARSEIQGNSTEPYGALISHDTVRIERILPGPVERVWAYITDSDKRAKWLAGGLMELREGGAVNLAWRNSDLSGGEPGPSGKTPHDGVDHTITGIVTRCEPPHLLAFNWSNDFSGSESIFELSEHGSDTKLVVTQQRVANRSTLISMSAGWHVHLGILTDVLSDTPPRKLWPEHARLSVEYEQRFAS